MNILIALLILADEPAITAAVEQYEAAFETLDPRAMIVHSELPLMAVSNRETTVMRSAEDVERYFAAPMTSLRVRRYSRSAVTDFRVKQMSTSLALVIVSRMRFDTRGEQIEWIGETLTLRKTQRGWKVVMTAVHNPVIGE
jgi:hypothetical protein